MPHTTRCFGAGWPSWGMGGSGGGGRGVWPACRWVQLVPQKNTKCGCVGDFRQNANKTPQKKFKDVIVVIFEPSFLKTICRATPKFFSSLSISPATLRQAGPNSGPPFLRKAEDQRTSPRSILFSKKKQINISLMQATKHAATLALTPQSGIFERIRTKQTRAIATNVRHENPTTVAFNTA